MDVRVLPATSLEEPASSWLTVCSLFFHRQWNGSMKKGERTCKIGRHGADLVSLLQVGNRYRQYGSPPPPKLAIECPLGYKKPF